MKMDIKNSYSPPVDQLLTYGKAEVADAKGWPDYLDLGFSYEHIPDLIHMALDEQLNNADSESLEVWAPTHAWRALGQLRAEAAIEPLLTLFHMQEDSEWVGEELPEVFGMIGPVALPAVAAYIADGSHNEWPRIHAMGCIEQIGKQVPEARSACIKILSSQLEQFKTTDLEFNAFLILTLTVAFKVVEAAPLMERAFAAHAVDESIIGDWDEVQVELGLKSREEVPQKRFQPYLDSSLLFPADDVATSSGKRHSDGVSRKKAKNKMAKQSRKKNRKR